MSTIRKLSYGLIAGTACLWCLAAVAEEREPSRDRAEQNDSQQQSEEEARIPFWLEGVDLEPAQREEILQIVREKNAELEQAWRDYHTQHMLAVELQAVWIASLRDALSEPQREEFNRRLDELQQESLGETEADVARPGALDDPDSETEPESESPGRPQQEERSDRTREDRQEEARSDREEPDETAAPEEQQETEPQVILYGITVITPETALEHRRMTRAQRRKCDETCHNYRRALRHAWRDARRAHHRMVEIEAEKIAAIDAVLTDEQRQQLQQKRAQPRIDQQAPGQESETREREREAPDQESRRQSEERDNS